MDNQLKIRANRVKFLKNHCRLIKWLILIFLVPKCSENQMHLENYPKYVIERGKGGVGNSKMADK